MTDLSDAEKLARAVLLFHDAAPWNEAKTNMWFLMTGTDTATTRTLCDLARKVRKQEEERQ